MKKEVIGVLIVLSIAAAFLAIASADAQQPSQQVPAGLVTIDCYICHGPGNALAYYFHAYDCPEGSTAVKASSEEKTNCASEAFRLQQGEKSEVDILKMYNAQVIDLNNNGKIDPGDSFTMPSLPASDIPEVDAALHSYHPGRKITINGQTMRLPKFAEVQYSSGRLYVRADLQGKGSFPQAIYPIYDYGILNQVVLRDGDMAIFVPDEKGTLQFRDLVINRPYLFARERSNINLNVAKIIVAQQDTSKLFGADPAAIMPAPFYGWIQGILNFL